MNYLFAMITLLFILFLAAKGRIATYIGFLMYVPSAAGTASNGMSGPSAKEGEAQTQANPSPSIGDILKGQSGLGALGVSP